MNLKEQALKVHEENHGKLAIKSKLSVKTNEELALAYTPGVAEPCKKIAENPEDSYKYTSRGNLVAVISDGTAVLGLGDIGPRAAMPVMEGKAILFKEFADIDSYPLVLNETNPDKLVEIISALQYSFGGINLEDISAPRCFEVEQKLKKRVDIPVFHDDQHGTAIVVVSGIINSLKIVDKKIEETKIVLNGPGAAGTAIIKLLQVLGATDIIACDQFGILDLESDNLTETHKIDLAHTTNPRRIKGNLVDAIKGADIFIGVSVPGILTKEMVKTMGKDPIVFAMANPVPEIMYEEAIEAGVKVMGTGRSDFPNQINNVLAFPGIFKGALSVRASEINEEMKKAAAYAIAGLITEEELSNEYVIPDPFDKRVVEAVANAVAKAAQETGVAKNTGGM
ncbi:MULTISPECIES: malic enzyme-like NAD(P)-binding protein [Vagococcus]|uniref:NADP-dependent malic enzyme n=1 Tax=Vagococcus fluvialis bH819 TaxID=1255619 RepID=A0A1X6WNM8_9ENTE|nr:MULTISPECIES: malic enzyme-like NAD(P)-binding protein [Vagococcus]SLM85933.1 NADP-dependent malic enzyme [Vagococcus fluvialis bH819]HCM88300.1 NAD-dependent malic enzyme [Vagococcus sp.]